MSRANIEFIKKTTLIWEDLQAGNYKTVYQPGDVLQCRLSVSTDTEVIVRVIAWASVSIRRIRVIDLEDEDELLELFQGRKIYHERIRNESQRCAAFNLVRPWLRVTTEIGHIKLGKAIGHLYVFDWSGTRVEAKPHQLFPDLPVEPGKDRRILLWGKTKLRACIDRLHLKDMTTHTEKAEELGRRVEL